MQSRWTWGGGADYELTLSPHATTETFVPPHGRGLQTSIIPSIKLQDGHPSFNSSSSSTSPATSFDTESTTFITPRSLLQQTKRTSFKMRFSLSKRNSASVNEDAFKKSFAYSLEIPQQNKRNSAPPPEKPVKAAPLPVEDLPPQTSRLPSFPAPPKKDTRRRPPELKLEPSRSNLRPSERSHEIDNSRLSPYRATHKTTAKDTHIGIQMLVNMFDESSDDEEEVDRKDRREQSNVLPSPRSIPSPMTSPRFPRRDTSMPSIDEYSASSSASDYSSVFDSRRHSMASTAPTTISDVSNGAPSPKYNPHWRRSFQSTVSEPLYENDSALKSPIYAPSIYSAPTSPLPPIPYSPARVPSSPGPRSPALKSSPGPRRPASTTCASIRSKSNRSSFISSRNSLVLGSSADSEIDPDEDHPEINAKNRISWFATAVATDSNQFEFPISDDEEEDIDDGESYHNHLVDMVPRRHSTNLSIINYGSHDASRPKRRSVPPMPTPPPPPPTGPLLQTPPARRTRRRTASSECVILESLEEMRKAGRKASLEKLQRELSSPKHYSSEMSQGSRHGVLGNTEAWDMMLHTGGLGCSPGIF
jgi:hypothetical protein